MNFANFCRTIAPALLLTVLSACSSGAYDAAEELDTLQNTGAIDSSKASKDAASANTQGAGDCSLSELDEDLLQALNQARAEARYCGSQFYEAVGTVTWNCQLQEAALAHAQDMGDNNFFSHSGSNGLRIGSRVTATNYSWSMVGENIAAGFYTVGSVMQGWLASPSHCSAIMNPSYKESATVAYIASNADYEVYWTMVLGLPVR